MYSLRERFSCFNTITQLNALSANEIMFIHNGIENISQALIGEVKNNSIVRESILNLNQNKNSNEDVSYRNNKISWIDMNDDNKWLYNKVKELILTVNQKFLFDLTDLEVLQYTVYETGEFYKKHIDTESTLFVGDACRKLSFSVQLTDPKEYEGGELLIHTSENAIVASKEFGSITFFPSFLLHEVVPVTKGKRVSLVGWVYGPTFK